VPPAAKFSHPNMRTVEITKKEFFFCTFEAGMLLKTQETATK
jgi:hypothetical protein